MSLELINQPTGWSAKGMQLDALIKRARQGKKPVGLSVSLDAPPLLEIASHFGFQWFVIDQEHTGICGMEALLRIIRSVERANVPFFVKLPRWDAVAARDTLDAGAFGLMVPFVDSADQLREMIDQARFPPLGHRGFCSGARATSFGSGALSGQNLVHDFIRFTNRDMLIIPTIESVRALDHLEELFEIDCPVWHVGLEDLALSIGNGEKLDLMLVRDHVRTIQEHALRAGKLLTYAIAPGSNGREVFDGFPEVQNDLPYVFDAECLALGCREAVESVRDARPSVCSI